MRSLARALGAELLKLRRTLALWMLVIAPAVVVALQFFGALRFRGTTPPPGDGWLMLARSVTNLWAAFMLPLFVALETALLAGVEHGAHTWKHLFALPVPRWAILAAKLLVAVACVVLAGAALIVEVAAAGHTLRILKPAFGLGPAVPWAQLLRQVGLVSAGALLMTVIHTWLAVRWPSYTAALATGVVGTFVTLFAISGTLGKYWPWAQSINTIGGNGDRLPLALAIGAGGALVAIVLAGWDLLRRDVA